MDHGRFLNEADSKELLEQFGVATPRRWTIDAATDWLLPTLGVKHVALKALSTKIVHKTDVGAVTLDIEPTDLASAVAEMSERLREQDLDFDGFLVEEMVSGGVDLVVGGHVDEAFGPCVMVGLGGIFVEVVEDVAFGICPVTRDDARSMVKSLRGFQLLAGFRGSEPVDLEAVVEAIIAIGGTDGIMMSRPEVHEIDVNPLKATSHGVVALDGFLRIGMARTHDARKGWISSGEILPHILQPKALAVLGASARGGAAGNVFLKNIREQGFSGRVYPIHPSAASIENLPAVRSLAELPEVVDYAFIAVPGSAVPDLLSESDGNVRVAQIMSSGFGETEAGLNRQVELVLSARTAGTRIIGPNCLGVYSPRGGLSFTSRSPKEPGSIAVISQSGGLGADVIHRGTAAGIRFSGVVSIGNGADLSAADFLEMFLSDAETEVVGLYLEDASQAPAMLSLLRSRSKPKPVVILRGGRTDAGRASAASHTGSLAGSDRLWSAFARQTGVIMVDSLNQFIEVLRLLEILRTRRGSLPSEEAVLIGNGGGVSVLGADATEQAGLQLRRFDEPLLTRLLSLEIPAGMNVQNPIDVPAGAFESRNGELLQGVFEVIKGISAETIVIAHMNLPIIQDNLAAPNEAVDRFIAGCLSLSLSTGSLLPPLLVLRSDSSKQSDNFRRRAAHIASEAGLPVYAEIADAAIASRRVLRWATKHKGTGGKAKHE